MEDLSCQAPTIWNKLPQSTSIDKPLPRRQVAAETKLLHGQHPYLTNAAYLVTATAFDSVSMLTLCTVQMFVLLLLLLFCLSVLNLPDTRYCIHSSPRITIDKTRWNFLMNYAG